MEGSAGAMRIPLDAIMDEEKFTQYLLKHRPVDDKSRFLAKVGFSLSNWKALKDAIAELARQTDAVEHRRDEYGTYWRCEGQIVGPAGTASVVLIFQERTIDGRFRFVTLRPSKRKEK